MKKIFLFLMSMFICVAMSAQEKYATTTGSFLDNWSVGVHGGINTPLNDVFGTISEQVGVQVDKYVSPAFGLGLEVDEYIGVKGLDRTAFDKTQIYLLGKLNIINLFGGFRGERRVFEPVIFAGGGWNHYNTSRVDNRDFSVLKAGAEFNFNFGTERQWTVQVVPAVVWDDPIVNRFHSRNAVLEVNAGIVYHFKNLNGSKHRTFAYERLYDYNEVNGLNSRVNQLRSEVDALTSALNNVQTVTETKTEVVEVPTLLFPNVQFYQGSADIAVLNEGNIKAIAETIKSTGADYVINGYASKEGTVELNQALSEKRAKAIKDKLVEYGVSASQLTTVGNGATEVFSGDSLDLNRVVVITRK
jgi:outer membrane protein OmpA-like peptidoglycan-associated protein